MTQTLLITGAAGYIGSFVNKLLLENGYQTIILDDLSKGKKEYVVGGELIVGNFGDRHLLKEVCRLHRCGRIGRKAIQILRKQRG